MDLVCLFGIICSKKRKKYTRADIHRKQKLEQGVKINLNNFKIIIF